MPPEKSEDHSSHPRAKVFKRKSFIRFLVVEKPRCNLIDYFYYSFCANYKMKKISIIGICCTLLMLNCEGFNIQTTTYDSIPDSSFGEISMKPFKRIGEKYYIVEGTEKLNWYAAQHFCRRLGANLASIKSAAEMKAISDYLKSIGHKGWFWLSGNDLSAESQFSWMGTGEAITYTNWSPGQPDNAGGNENCVHLWPHADGFAMNDWQCNQNTHYICEADSPKLVSFAVW